LNWLGHLLQNYISKDDTVLDVGCGIMQATTDNWDHKKNFFGKRDILQCKHLLGVDAHKEYLKQACKTFPVLQLEIKELDRFVDNSFDVVICLDVLEHIELDDALWALRDMERIARKKVIIYTPSTFHSNEQNAGNAWNMGANALQLHRCFLSPEILKGRQYDVSFPEPDKNTLAIKQV
jgi:ubiquinone/menaquinone biosynthesis C-methylase UbiE